MLVGEEGVIELVFFLRFFSPPFLSPHVLDTAARMLPLHLRGYIEEKKKDLKGLEKSSIVY